MTTDDVNAVREMVTCFMSYNTSMRGCIDMERHRAVLYFIEDFAYVAC